MVLSWTEYNSPYCPLKPTKQPTICGLLFFAVFSNPVRSLRLFKLEKLIMKAYKVILIALVLSSLVLTSCGEDTLTSTVDPDFSSSKATPSSLHASSGYGVLSSIDIQLEAALTVEKHGCPNSDREEVTRNTDDRPIECLDYYVATGTARGLTQEFGNIKAELTIKYSPSSDEITGLIALVLESTDETLTLQFRGSLSGSNNEGDMFRFRALSNHSFMDRYFSGFFSIQDLDQLLKSYGQKNIPISIKGVLE